MCIRDSFYPGPVYAAALWLCVITSRRISETLRLRGSDVHLSGGEDHDYPYARFAERSVDTAFPRLGKLGRQT
eukprot:10446803-Alexandrium_andersonii.AAC.1